MSWLNDKQLHAPNSEEHCSSKQQRMLLLEKRKQAGRLQKMNLDRLATAGREEAKVISLSQLLCNQLPIYIFTD